MKMPKFSEPELCLFKKWKDARLLEDSLKTVRTKYAELAEPVVDRVGKRHPELNYNKVHFSRDGTYGIIAIGKASWPKGKEGYPTGYSIENIDLDSLLSPDLDSPCKTICIYGPDGKDLEQKIQSAGKRLLGSQEFAHWDSFNELADGTGAGISRSLEPRSELFKLVSKDESSGFIECMVRHFEQMVKFTTAIDDILRGGKRRRR